MEHVQQSNHLTQNIQFGEDKTKLLSTQWCFSTDILSYCVNINQIQRVTKRIILSETAKLFDPLGLLAPVIMVTKILMQMT